VTWANRKVLYIRYSSTLPASETLGTL
jgi:hypothetical protein